jgi:galactonate dehydratase
MNRRELLQLLNAAPLAAAFGPSRVTVTGLEIFRVKVNRRGDWVLIRLNTSAGVTGIGEASHGGRDELTVQWLRQFFELLKGRGVFDIERLRAAVEPEIARRGTPAAVAFSALEQCLWDIQGKLFGVPCYNLFGGSLRTRIRNYANINRSTEDRSPAGFAKMAESAVRAGFDAVKLAPFDDLPSNLTDPARIEELTRLGIECARAVRQTIGPKRDLLIDAHSRFNLERGLDLARRFEPLNLFWIEEVTPAAPLENLAAINRVAKMPTAGGETIYGVKGFYPYIAAKAVDILMPDVKYCGGMLELKKIAALAEAAGMPVSPHGPASPVGNVVAAHLCAGLPNFLILELAYGEVPWRAELIDPPEQLLNGHLSLSERPGLGISLNEKTLRRYGNQI